MERERTFPAEKKRSPEALTQKKITPQQCCPEFTSRDGALPCERECWFCVYADFQLEKEKPLEVGTCGYPIKNRKLKKRRR
jgi:hypothetical protein